MTIEDLAEKLDRIEKALVLTQKRVLNLDEACLFTGFSKSYLYKLTSQGVVPHSQPMGKTIFFDREKLEQWMLKNYSMSNFERDAAASTYVTTHRHGNLKSQKEN